MSARPRVTAEALDPAALAGLVAHAGAGAVLTFTGVVRDRHLDREVVGIDYHAYAPMAEREIERIEARATERWREIRIAIVHRIGPLAIGDASVAIAVASPHRAEGFDALRFAIEEIKRHVPVWKREVYPDGHAWIEGS